MTKALETAWEKVEKKDLLKYADLFFKRLNPTLVRDQKKLNAQVYNSPEIVGMFFEFVPLGKQIKRINFIETDYKKILELALVDKDHFSAKKSIKGFLEKSFFCVKLNRKIHWHQVIAFLDLHEITHAMLIAGRNTPIKFTKP